MSRSPTERFCSGSIRPVPAPEHQPDLPRHDPSGTARGRAEPGRHLHDVMGNFPPAGVRQDRNRSIQRSAGLLLVRVLRALDGDQQADEVVVWVEQGGFGAAAAAPVARQLLSQWFYGNRGPFPGGVLEDAMSTVPTPIRTAEAPAEARPRTVFTFDPLLPARRARTGRVLADHAQGRDPQRCPRAPALLRRAPGDLRRDRAAAGGAADADRLLAAARVQAVPVRADDRPERGRVRHARDSRPAPLDPAAVPAVPGVGVREDPAGRVRSPRSRSTGPAGCTSAVRPRGSCCWR